MTNTTLRRAGTGLVLLALFAAACTANITIDPTVGLDSGGETDDVDELLQTAREPNTTDAATAGTVRDRPRASSDDPPVILVNPPAATTTTDPGETNAPPADTAASEAAEKETTAPAAGATAGSGDMDTPTPAAESTSTTATAPGGSPPGDDEDLPGESYEYGPDEGASLAVVGVDHDDVLNVRDVPAGEIIATLGLGNPIAFLLEVSDASGEPIDWFDSWDGAIVATGRTRKLPTTVWHEVTVVGLVGWASGAYLAPVGLTDDITAYVIERLGERLSAPTLTELGVLVGETLASVEPLSRVVVTVGPSVFEAVGEISVDVLNIGDDSLLGFRLHVVADPHGDWMSEDPGPFTLRSVARTILCQSSRGVTEEGLCR